MEEIIKQNKAMKPSIHCHACDRLIENEKIINNTTALTTEENRH